jgi:hypothetical protein
VRESQGLSASHLVSAFLLSSGVPVFTATRALGLPDGAAAAISVLLQIAVFVAILVILVRTYGNAFAKTPPNA